MKEKIAKIIEKEFGQKAKKIVKITEGYSHTMYEVKLEKAPHEAIIRFANNTMPDVSLLKEKYVIRLLKKQGMPVPKILAFHYPEKNKKEGYMILEKFTTPRLDVIWEELSREERLDITQKIGKLMKKMHKITFKKFGAIEERGEIETDEAFVFKKVGESNTCNQFLRINLKYMLKGIARLLAYDTVDKKLAKSILNYIVDNLNTIKYHGTPVFVHGDIQKGHIFVEKVNGTYEIQGIIDFEFAQSYPPEYDFIKLHREGFFEDKELLAALQKGYGTIDTKTVRMHRIMLDTHFAQIMLDVGNQEMYQKTMNTVKKMVSGKT